MAKIKGFTVLELLVVVLISGVLAVMALPALSSARDGDHRARCQKNLKELGLAQTLYMNDFEGIVWHGGSYSVDLWASRLVASGYVEDVEGGSDVFRCPAYLTPAVKDWSPGGSNPGMWPWATYGINMTGMEDDDIPCYRSRDASGKGTGFYVESRRIRIPSNYWLLTEGTNTKGGAVTMFRYDRWVDHLKNISGRSAGIHLRHEGETANMLFFDGHVESAGSSRLKEIGPIAFESGFALNYELRSF